MLHGIALGKLSHDRHNPLSPKICIDGVMCVRHWCLTGEYLNMEYNYYVTINGVVQPLSPNTVLTRCSVDGMELKTALVELLWANSEELISRELDEMQ